MCPNGGHIFKNKLRIMWAVTWDKVIKYFAHGCSLIFFQSLANDDIKVNKTERISLKVHLLPEFCLPWKKVRSPKKIKLWKACILCFKS